VITEQVWRLSRELLKYYKYWQMGNIKAETWLCSEVTQLVIKISIFTEPEELLPCSQQPVELCPHCYTLAIKFRLNIVRSPRVTSRPPSRTSLYISRLSHAPSIFHCTTLLELLPQMGMSKNYEKSFIRNFNGDISSPYMHYIGQLTALTNATLNLPFSKFSPDKFITSTPHFVSVYAPSRARVYPQII
jgi:hypothetical protein